MNINELEELAKEWDRFDADNEYSQSFLELIAAYREAIDALKIVVSKPKSHEALRVATLTLDSAKRLGVE